MKTTWNIGDRVRMVQTESLGTIASRVKRGAGADGTDRIAIRWDRTGKTNDWNPGFLRPAHTLASDDPDEVIVEGTGRRRAKTYLDQFGTTIVIPEGFFVVPKDEPKKLEDK